MDSQCLLCHLRRNVETARKLGDEETATEFARELMKLYLSVPKEVSSPYLAPATSELFQRFYGLEPDRFRQEKEQSNRFVLTRMEEIRRRVDGASDKLLAALQFAVLGNYIDFSALQGQVSFRQLDELLDSALQMELDMDAYGRLQKDLEAGKELLYLTDNAGEICFDRIFAEKIAERYPHLSITFCVRGGPAMNDATREDAELVGIPFPVIDNGNCVAGTEISLLSPQAREYFDRADVILAKGQGNLETLFGCGKNIYYAFLVKCVKFQQYFQKPQLTPMLVREKNR